MVLALLAFLAWTTVERFSEAAAMSDLNAAPRRRTPGWAAAGALGSLCGLLFLAEYSAGSLVLVALGAALVRRSRRPDWLAFIAIAVGFAAIAGPWVVRNNAPVSYTR